jgi:hypothetical protein
MSCRLLAILTAFGIINGNPDSVVTFHKILEYSKNVYYKRAEIMMDFEYNNRIGLSWFEMNEASDKEITYNFNYMRFDENGRILTDMRNFKVIPAYLEKYGIDWARSIPTLHYITDKMGNSWLIYSYGENGWHIGWLQVDKTGRIVANNTSILKQPTKPLNLVAAPDDLLGFHLFWTSVDGKVYYYNPSFDEAKSLSKRDFFYSEAGVGLSQSCFLLINPPNANNRTTNSDSFEFRIIDNNGRLIKKNKLPWRSLITYYWDKVDLPIGCKTFAVDNSIYFIFPFGDKINLIYFTLEGEIIAPKICLARETLSIDNMPMDASRFIKIEKGILYYYGFDGDGNLYYCKSHIEDKIK